MSFACEERLTAKVREQLRGKNLGFLLGAGSSYSNGSGYPLTSALGDTIMPLTPDVDAGPKSSQSVTA